MKQRNRKKLSSEEHDVLKAIYERRSRGGRLDRFEQRQGSRRKKILIIVAGFVFLASLLAVAGFVFFSRSEPFASAKVTLAMTGAETAASGDEYVFTVVVKNDGAVGLRNVQVSLQYPGAFTFVSAAPKANDEFGNRWELGELAGNGTAEVKIRGVVVADIGSTVTLSGSVRYEPKNFSSTFSSDAELSTTVRSSPLSIRVDGPTTATNGQVVTLSIFIKNDQKETLKRVRVELVTPKEFKDVSYEPKAEGGSWNYAELKSGAEETIVLKATLTGTAGQVAETRVRVGIVSEGGELVIQREQSALIVLLSPTLNAELTVDGTTTGRAIAPDEELNVKLQVRNDSDTVFQNVTVRLQAVIIDSDGKSHGPLDVASVVSTPDAKTEADSVTWVGEHSEALKRMIPDAEATFTANVPLMGNLRSVGSGTNFSLKLSAAVTATVEETGTSYEKKVDALIFPITTELRLSASKEFLEGAEVPTVGQSSRYRLLFRITNTLNGVNDALFKTALPEGVSFVSAEQSEGNAVSFDETTRELLWRVPAIEAKTGQTKPTVTATVVVSITPIPETVGTAVTLAERSTLSGTDAYSKAKLSTGADAVKTDAVLTETPTP